MLLYLKQFGLSQISTLLKNITAIHHAITTLESENQSDQTVTGILFTSVICMYKQEISLSSHTVSC